MAKNEIEVKVKVDDKGSLKKVAADSKKANKGLQETDRTMKGASRQSSNSTKNFSKMSQGITGGLVPAYAVLAASVFAISAAFEFLKSAADLRVLQEGQLAYAAATGTAMSLLAKDMQAATDGQIAFKDASQGAAIGLASGIQQDQLIGLSKAARDASSVLGRDVTDSFNRLIRGATKAEPELLDELGIILRLEDAKRKYAQATGLQADKLTAFQRTQAVTNEILEQSEEKYGRILEILDPTSSAINKLGVSFNSLINTVKIALVSVAEPIATFLSVNILSTVALFGFLGSSIVKSMIPPLDKLKENVDSTHARMIEKLADQENVQRAKVASIKASLDQELNIRAQHKTKLASLMATQGPINTKAAQGGGAFITGLTDSSRAKANFLKSLVFAEKAVLKSAGVKSGIFKGYSAQNLAIIRQMYNEMDKASTRSTVTVANKFKLMTSSMQTGLLQVKTMAATTFASLRMGAAQTLVAFSKLLYMIPYIGLAFLAWDLVKGVLFPLSELEKEAEKLTGGLEELNKILEVSRDLLKEFPKAGAEGSAYLGNLLGNLSTENMSKGLKAFQADQANIKKFLSFDSFSDINISDLIFGNDVSDESKKFLISMKSIASNIENGGIAAEGFKNALNNIYDIDPANFAKLVDAVKEQAVASKEFLSSMKEASSVTGRFVAETFKANRFDAPISALENAIKKTEQQVANQVLLSDSQKKANTENKELMKDLIILRKTEQAILEEGLALKIATVGITDGMSSNEAANLQKLVAIRQKMFDISKAAQQLDKGLAAQRAAETSGNANSIAVQKENVALLRLNLDIAYDQEASLRRQITLAYKFGQTFKNSLESNIESGIAALIKNTESSLKDTFLNLVKGVAEAIADTVAKEATSMIMGGLGFKSAEQKAAEAMGMAFEVGGDSVARKIVEALGGKTSDAASAVSGGAKSVFSKAKTFLFGRKVTSDTNVESGNGVDVHESEGTKSASAGGIFSPVINTFKSLFDKDGTFLASFGGLFKGLGGMLSNVFGSLFGGSGKLASTIAGALFANGGVASGGFKAFANGGTVSKPTMGLVGEGKYNEAIVPLPDGKSIPVIGAGGNNMVNVVVNVSDSEASTTTTGDDGAGMKQLGSMLGNLVKQEIVNQSRPGGLLRR